MTELELSSIKSYFGVIDTKELSSIVSLFQPEQPPVHDCRRTLLFFLREQ